MNCYECRRESGATTPAEAVCQRCGAGVCVDHVSVEIQELHQQVGLGQPRAESACPSHGVYRL
ncbi:DUF2180 family protein [Streptomyces sp. NBC_00467]|uniref:DUF2180 family protein n=1 Tax=Streptomyces sp. NBC_00467 TaxID=2975752 RepID=UPI003FA770BF